MKPKRPKPKKVKRRPRPADVTPVKIKPANGDGSGHCWTPREREIYSYFDGTTRRVADPLAISRALITAPEVDWDTDLKLIATILGGPESVPPAVIKAAMQATGRVVGAIRYAFGIKPLWEGGLTDVELLELRGDFAMWMEEIKKKVNQQPISQPATAWTPPSGSPANGSPTPSPLASPSALGESCSDMPTSSPPASEQR